MSDLIRRKDAIDLLRKRLIETAINNVGYICDAGQTFEDASERIKYWIDEVPSAQPYTEAEIQTMQDLEQAQIEKAFELGKEEGRKEAQPKTGKWEAVKRSDGVSIDFRCSACHRFRFHNGELRRYKYCPECGCRMLEEGEEHD